MTFVLLILGHNQGTIFQKKGRMEGLSSIDTSKMLVNSYIISVTLTYQLTMVL